MLSKEISYSQAHSQLASTLNDVEDNRSIIVIRRQGRPGVALIAEDELSSMMENLHVLSSPANARRLFDALDRSEQGDYEPLTEIRQLAEDLGFGQEEQAQATAE